MVSNSSCIRGLIAHIYSGIEANLPEQLPPFDEWISSFSTRDDLKYGLIQLLDEIAERCSVTNGETKHVIQQAREYIDQNFYENLTLDVMAQKFNMNRTYFSDLFKQEVGDSFKRYLIQTRIRHAMDLLAKKEMKAVNVALIVGFNDPIYFSRVFKKYTGISVTEFKENA